MTVLVCALPFAAHAQWGTTETEHDWRLTIAGRSYGLVQQVTYVGARLGGTRTTTIWLGSYAAKSRIPAVYLATIVLLPVTVLGCFLLTGLLRNKGGLDPAAQPAGARPRRDSISFDNRT